MTKCNNCRFKTVIDGVTVKGRIVAKEDKNVFLLNESGYNIGYLTAAGLVDLENRQIENFEMVSRDPETYRDWQEGDSLLNEDISSSGELPSGRVITL